MLSAEADTPAAVVGNLRFAGISVGGGQFSHTCAVGTGGAAFCRGPNEFGQLGDGTKEDKAAPTPVVGNLAFTSVTAGQHFTCGVTTDGAGFCWGLNLFSNLGDGTATESSTPVRVRFR